MKVASFTHPFYFCASLGFLLHFLFSEDYEGTFLYTHLPYLRFYSGIHYLPVISCCVSWWEFTLCVCVINKLHCRIYTIQCTHTHNIHMPNSYMYINIRNICIHVYTSSYIYSSFYCTDYWTEYLQF